MGLDMYLDRKRELNWEEIQGLQDKFPKAQNPIYGIKEEVAYWRKANQIHNFFMKKDVNGEDRQADVDINDIKELLKICKRLKRELKLTKGKIHTGTRFTKDGKEEMYEEGEVIANPELAEELLPTRAGFFFGKTDYDSYYYKQICKTIPVLQKIVDEHNKYENVSYEYIASW